MASQMMVITIPIVYITAIILASNAVEASIGMNWGRVSAQRLVPSEVVDLLLQNGIGNARIYSSELDILKAFTGSGINLTVGIGNAVLFASSYDAAKGWVNWKGSYFTSTNTRRVMIGETVFYKGLKDKNYVHQALDSLKNVQHALNDAGYGDIKATIQVFHGTLNQNRTKPSEAEFIGELKEEIITLVRILQENNSPFFIEMFPIIDVTWIGFDPSFAFLDNKSTQIITDINGAVYTNIFEFVYDSFAWALEKINASALQIVVGQVGWPTDGHLAARVDTAERFYKGLLPLVASNKGTPKRPGKPIDVYLQSLTDENRMPYGTSPFNRHWGIYRSNGVPKYKIDLSGKGRDIFPTMAKGVMRMPERWCMFNENMTDLDKVQSQFNYACEKADCTSLMMEGSCSQLTLEQNVSYAFNIFFQSQFQDERACDFGGLGYVSVHDPSTGHCVFPVEVVRGRQLNYVPFSVGGRVYERPSCGIFALLVSILWAILIC